MMFVGNVAFHKPAGANYTNIETSGEMLTSRQSILPENKHRLVMEILPKVIDKN